MQFSIRFRSLSSRIIVLVMVSLGVFTLASGLVAYYITQGWLEKTAVANLEALASARQATLHTQLRDFRDSIRAFSQPNLATEVAALLSSEGAEREAKREELLSSVRRKLMAFDHTESACILSALEGTEVVSTMSGIGEKPDKDSLAFREGLKRLFILDPFAEGGNIFLDLALPLLDEQGDPIAVLILRVSGREILDVTGDYTGLGRTGESVLGARRGDMIHFLAPLRFDPDLSKIQSAPVSGERAKPMIHATAGQSGTINAPDYRGVSVIAAFRPIKQTDWGLVVKQDTAETFASIDQMRAGLLFGLCVLLLIGAIFIIPLARNFTRPVRDLQRATRKVSAGDLSAHVPVETMDEVGELARSFNAMVDGLREAHEDSEKSNQELSSFAYVVSHDLKAPLRAIHNLSDWLREDLGDQLDEEHRNQLDLLRQRVRRMDGLINGLLEYSRIGRVHDSVGLVQVGKLLNSVIDSVSPPEYIIITATADTPVLEADELRLGQVFQNLIQNAVKHHPGPEGKVEVGCRDAGEHWEFSVSDDGAGIDPRHHERIFQVFQTLGVGGESESTGIGLSLVKKIVEEQGGEVRVESDGLAGHGTTFRFTWPKRKDSSP